MRFNTAVEIPSKRVLAPNFEAIESAGLPDMGNHWCVWLLSDKGGTKPKKIPSNGKRFISSQRPVDWISYQSAKTAYLGGGWDGIGYLPNPDDGITALDADGVIAPDSTVGVESGREIVEALEAVGCYLERSPSGSGLRGFVRGQKKGRKKTTINGHSVEAYQPDNSKDGEKGQYVTITGECWGGFKPIEYDDAQIQLDQFLIWSGLSGEVGDGDGGKVATTLSDTPNNWVKRTDDEVTRLLLSSLNPQGRYSRLMLGDISGHDGESEARYALLCQLAYITRDDEQIERIVRTSNLEPARFDEKRNNYRNRLHYEITRALKDKDRSYDIDRAEKIQSEDRKTNQANALKAKAADRLHGGFAGLLDGNNKLKPDMPTISELLIRDTKLLGVLWFDEFAGTAKKSISFAEAFGDKCAPNNLGMLEDDDLLAVTVWIRNQWGITPDNQNTIRDSVKRWARSNPINPVTERLQAFADEWDGIKRLDTWLVDYLRVSADDEAKAYYLAEVGKRFLIGVVARAFVPGTQQDQMLILENPAGGEGKSAAVRILARAIDESAYLEGFSPSDNKDTLQQMRGKLLGEWGELDGFDRRESEWVKNFITRVSDTYRDPYGTFNRVWPRTISFIATANKDDYLRDLGGRRRYWPVRVGDVDLEKLMQDAPQLWGEAVRLYQSGTQFWVDKNSPADARFRALCDVEQRKRLTVTAFDDMALDLANKLVNQMVSAPGMNVLANEWSVFSVSQMKAMLFGNTHISTAEWNQMAAALKRCDWSNGTECNLPGKNKGWKLTTKKAEELRRINGLGGPPPKPTKSEETAFRRLMREYQTRETIS